MNTTTGNGDKQSPVFDITGTSFRLNVDSTATSQDPQFAGITIFVYPEGETVSSVADFAVEEGRDDSSIVNAGPASFYLDVIAANVDYTITVEDCTGTDGEPTNSEQITLREGEGPRDEVIIEKPIKREPTVINIPQKPLPPTGGLPVYGMVAGSILAGLGLLGLGISVGRGGPRR